ncbi:MAG: hypothetical protein EOP56_13290 [Sphingobacteriales bacterium]|nr:MAG: hypothetical protein EOP56_13290 [Sphingobacteriales bacterium]
MTGMLIFLGLILALLFAIWNKKKKAANKVKILDSVPGFTADDSAMSYDEKELVAIDRKRNLYCFIDEKNEYELVPFKNVTNFDKVSTHCEVYIKFLAINSKRAVYKITFFLHGKSVTNIKDAYQKAEHWYDLIRVAATEDAINDQREKQEQQW